MIRFVPREAGLSAADLVIVNPPRRGIGPNLAGRLEESVVGDVIYSSCNVDSQARDLAAMPSFCVQEARLFDMFPRRTTTRSWFASTATAGRDSGMSRPVSGSSAATAEARRVTVQGVQGLR
ncbi:MAG TPA: hypothetical protein VFY98_11880 [Intrasporangium sp.]|nr:hypothetical protein [Intrasporangium sp.]